MCKAAGYPKLPAVLFIQLQGHVLAKGRAVLSDIYRHVENPPAQHSDKLTLRPRILDMESSQDAARRARQIILHERPSNPDVRIAPRLKVLQEKPSWISEDRRLDDY